MIKYICLALLAINALAFGQTATSTNQQTRWEKIAADRKQREQGITWTTHEPIEFLMRRGDHFDDEQERYAKMYQPENIKQMADAGVRWGRLFFYKGFGLQFERPNIEKSKAAADLMHKLGMKVALYMAGTMFTETLYQELPKAKSWEQRDQNNLGVTYGTQTFRHYACPNEPGYRDYLKKILRIGVEDLHADEISFDNLMLQPEPKSCHCPRCAAAFHQFLSKRYPTKDAMMRRFGLPKSEWVELPEWVSETHAESITAINDPVLQEWVRFRCESLANYANDLSAYVKGLNSNVVVYMNIKGMFSFNRYWANAVYHPLYAGHVDVIAFDTGGYDSRIDKNTGALVSQIRSYKVATMIGSACDAPMGDELNACLQMAFGHQITVKDYVGAPWVSGANSACTPSVEFFREYNARYFTGTENVADVAVLHNWPSMAYSINATYTPVTLFEQVLIQHKVPFDILFDEEIDRLSKYQEVVLAGQECVGDEQAKLLLDYVRGGGTLILTGNTGEYNQWREKRRSNPLLPARQEGKGRILYIPEVESAEGKKSKSADDQDPEPGATLTRGTRMTPSQWVLPKNHEAINKTVVDGLPKGLTLDCNAPLNTVANILTRPESRETLVHFINYEKKSLEPFKTTVRKEFDGPVKSVKGFTFEADEPVAISFEETADHVIFAIPAARRYMMVVISQ